MLHIDFTFYNVTSIRGFVALLTIVDAKTHMLWVFATPNKQPPLRVILFFLDTLRREGCACRFMRTDEDGALARSSEFTSMLLDEYRITLQTTGGFASWLNSKNERQNQTIHNMTRAGIIDGEVEDDKWCCGAEPAAEVLSL